MLSQKTLSLHDRCRRCQRALAGLSSCSGRVHVYQSTLSHDLKSLVQTLPTGMATASFFVVVFAVLFSAAHLGMTFVDGFRKFPSMKGCSVESIMKMDVYF